MKRIIMFFVVVFLLIVTCGNTAPAAVALPSPAVRELILQPMPTRPVEIEEVIITEEPVETEIIEEEIVEVEEEVEFPNAKFIWDYLHDLGYNDAVSAGIIGNIMVECGGHTLDLQVTVESNVYYGMCQWMKKYYPGVIGCSLEEQCDFLRDTIKGEFNTFGGAYKKGFNYEAFLELTNERDAALAFAKVYERCSSGGYTLRQNCATIAYEYFVKPATAPGSAER